MNAGRRRGTSWKCGMSGLLDYSVSHRARQFSLSFAVWVVDCFRQHLVLRFDPDHVRFLHVPCLCNPQPRKNWLILCIVKRVGKKLRFTVGSEFMQRESYFSAAYWGHQYRLEVIQMSFLTHKKRHSNVSVWFAYCTVQKVTVVLFLVHPPSTNQLIGTDLNSPSMLLPVLQSSHLCLATFLPHCPLPHTLNLSQTTQHHYVRL